MHRGREQVSNLLIPHRICSYMPRNILENDDSFCLDLNQLHRIAWITELESDKVKKWGVFTKRFNRITPLDTSGGRGKGCKLCTPFSYIGIG